MIHKIHENKQPSKHYLLNNIEFLFDYYDGNISKNDSKTVNKYLLNTNHEPMMVTESNMCCGLHLRQDEGLLICSRCGIQRQALDTCISSFVETIVPVYTRLAHFKKILQQLQGIETFTFKHKQCVSDYITKHRLKNIDTATMKQILKKLKLTDCYDHVQLIRKYFNQTVPFIDQELERQLIHLFKQVDEQYVSVAPNNKNFLNYHFLLSKFFIMLNRKEFIPYLQNIKCQNKLSEANKLFSKIQFNKID